MTALSTALIGRAPTKCARSDLRITATSTPISTGAVKSKLLLGLDDTALRHVRDAAQVRGMGPNENVTVAGERPDNLFCCKRVGPGLLFTPSPVPRLTCCGKFQGTSSD